MERSKYTKTTNPPQTKSTKTKPQQILQTQQTLSVESTYKPTSCFRQPVIRFPMARPLQVIHSVSSASYVGLAAPVMTLLLCAFALLMCASHSRKWRHWSSSSCCDAFAEDPVIEVNNEVAVTNADQQEAASSLWQKNILMGGKCQLPDFSGVIIYDSNGNIVTPAKNSRRLLTWK